MKTFPAVATASLLFSLIVSAQTGPPAPAYGYAAVSIHHSDPNERDIHITGGPQGGIRTTNTSVLKLIAYAYHLQDYQIAGAPAWASSESFDVTFTPDNTEVTPDSEDNMQKLQAFFDHNSQRTQAVLRDRFGLVIRIESLEQPIYRLVEAKGGNKLVPHTDDAKRVGITTNNNRQIRAGDATMDMLAGQLSMQFGRPVRNETHIDGRYDFTIDWVPDPDLPEGPVIEAINNKLGLRLESAKGPVPVYVIEKIHQPTNN